MVGLTIFLYYLCWAHLRDFFSSRNFGALIGKIVKSELKFPIWQIRIKNEAIFFDFSPIVTHVKFTPKIYLSKCIM